MRPHGHGAAHRDEVTPVLAMGLVHRVDELAVRAVERLLQRIQELTNEGVSLAGVRKILELEAEAERLQQRIAALDAALAAAHEAHETAVRDVHRSYRRDLVPLSRAVVRSPRR